MGIGHMNASGPYAEDGRDLTSRIKRPMKSNHDLPGNQTSQSDSGQSACRPVFPDQTNTAAEGRHSLVGLLGGVLRRFSPAALLWHPSQDLSFEEIRKRKLFAVLLIPGILVMSTFGGYHIFFDSVVEGTIDLTGALWLLISLFCLRLMKRGVAVYRLNSAILGLLFIYLAAKGGAGGNKLLWSFSFPLIAFYTLGITEGLLWTVALFLLMLAVFSLAPFFPFIYVYGLDFKIRFGAAFILVASMTYIYESVRWRSQSRLEDETRKLAEEKRKLAAMSETVQQANQALTLSEQRLKQAQSIAHVGNLEYDGSSGRLWGSEEALRILGLDPAQPEYLLTGQHHPVPADFLPLFENLLKYGQQRDVELTVKRHSDQQMVILHTRFELAPSPFGHPPKVIGVIQDITARRQAEIDKKELEARLARSQQMEALGLLAGGVAHDLNNVLSGIVSYPDLLLMQLQPGDGLAKPLKVIRDSGQKAAAIVQDLLTLARRAVTNMEVLNLNAVITEYLGSPELEKLTSYHPGVEIQAHLAQDLLNIRGSAVHLKKTVMNLVSNAAEALPDGGLVQVSTACRYLDRPLQGYSTIQEGDYVILRVEDNGTGISPEDLGRIFEPFYTKKKMGRSGTGLGLAVVWGTVEDHHGYINLASTRGQGAVIEIYLPVCREALAAQQLPAPATAYMGHGELILVVDDVPTQREIAAAMLNQLGYRVAMAESGEAAVTFLQNQPVDLLILDMVMDPGMDGLETYKRVYALRPGQKAIIVSGYSETDRVKTAQALGAGEYVRKPYSLEKLGLAVRRELDGS
jgi:signal transduction histidine kinase/ActR/RegA family two-component response regulator